MAGAGLGRTIQMRTDQNVNGLSTDDDDDEVMLNVLRCQLTYYGQVVTNAEAWFNNSLRPRKPEGSLGRTAQDGHLDSHTAPELWFIDIVFFFFYGALRPQKPYGLLGTGGHC